MKMVQERVERMDASQDVYFLVDHHKIRFMREFKIVKRDDELKVRTIQVLNDGQTSCSCPDWKARCKNKAIACKHIYFLLHTVIKYELFDYYDN